MAERRTVVVTGASKGLGLAIADHLAGEGYRIVGISRSLGPGFAALRASLPEGQIVFCSADLSESAGIHGLCRRVAGECGPVYALVNNAAIGLEGLLATQHERDIQDMVALNLTAAMLMCKYLSRTMLSRGEGRIVNIASIIAHTGLSGLSVYAATKAAMVGFSRSLARELGRAGITVNTVCPGFMQTDMTAGLDAEKFDAVRRRSPLGRFVLPAEVAAAVGFLLGDAAGAVTGTEITVDAGSTA